MEQELIQFIKDLSGKVNILYNEREANSTHQEQEMKVQSSNGEDPYLRARAPMYEVENYPQLTEEFSDMEKNIFRFPLKDKEKKEIVYGFPKFKAINYLPPPLNDSTSTAVKKVDGLLYNIQQSLANITRPIDLYRHDQLRKNRVIDPKNDEDIIILET
ncbi:hypothetical protein BB561_006971, partial [Smittium simulii]